MPEMDIVDTLLAARDIVAESWCQNAPGRTASGEGVLANHPDAVSWCMAGAIEKASGTDYMTDAHRFAYRYLVGEKHVGIFGFNDLESRTKWQVVGMLDEIATAAKEAGVS